MKDAAVEAAPGYDESDSRLRRSLRSVRLSLRRLFRRSAGVPRSVENGILTPARGVVSCSQGDVVVLMSLQTTHYHTLDEVGSRVWEAIGQGSEFEAVIRKVMAGFEASDASAADEIGVFIRELIQRNLVELNAPRRLAKPAAIQSVKNPGTPVSKVPSLPPVFVCVIVLALVSLALPVLGLERIWRRAHVKTLHNRAPLVPGYVDELTRRVTAAAAVCPFRTQCLEQSLLTLWLLRCAGAEAHLRFGVLQYPFLAHAWVESAGVPVNDSAEALKLYRPFPLVDVGAN